MLVESDQKEYRQQCNGLLRSFRWHAEIVLQKNEIKIGWLVFVFVFVYYFVLCFQMKQSEKMKQNETCVASRISCTVG